MVKRYDDHAFVYYNIIFETYTYSTDILSNIYIILDGLEGDTRIYCQRC